MKAFFSSFKTTLFSLFFLLIATAGWGQVTATYTFSVLGGSNVTTPSGNIDENISYVTATNTAGTSTNYNSGEKDLRLYNNITKPYPGGSINLTANNGVTITGVQFETLSSDYIPTMRYSIGTAAFNASDPNVSRSGTTYSISGLNITTSMKIRNANTSTMQMRMLSIKVTYTTPATIPVVTDGIVSASYGSPMTNYQIIATGAPASYAVASGALPAGLSLNTTTGVISGTPTVAGSSAVTVTATNGNGTSPAATLNFVIAKKSVTISGLTGSNKVYDGLSSATVTGTLALNGVLPADVSNVTISGAASYAFSNPNVGVAKPIVVTGITLSGTAAGNYTLIQPSDLTANITAKTVTVTGVVAQNKVYDGTLVAAISGGTLTGVIASDAANVSVSTVGTFATANVGTGIVVTVSLTGSASANYALTQPSVTADITKANQTITFNTLPSLNLSSNPINLNTYASASSGLALTYLSSDPTVVSVSGNTLTVVGSGTATITALQSGNSNYNAATDVTRNVTVTMTPISIFANAITGGGQGPGSVNPFIGGQTFNTNITVSGIGHGVGISGVTGNDRYNTSNYTAGSSTLVSDEYFEFMLTPNAGYNIDFDEFKFTIQKSASGPETFEVRSSLDGFSSDLQVYSYTGAVTKAETLSLSGTEFADITSPITFRIYGYNAAAITGTANINDFNFKGNVLCIKPTAYVVSGLKNACGTTAVITLSDSEVDMSYQLLLNGVNFGEAIAGTGDLLDFGIQSTSGTYTIIATNIHCVASTTMVGNVVVLADGTTTWNGSSWNNGVPIGGMTAIITGNYSEAADITACSLTISNNANVTIPTGNSVTLSGIINVESGSTFTVESDANFIQRQNDAINIGNITVKRNSNIKRLDYVYWSSPVANQKFVDFSPKTIISRFLTYNEGTDTFTPIDLTESIQTKEFVPGVGYAVRAPNNHNYPAGGEADWLGVFTGQPNNGTINSFELKYSKNGYNLVGNPYPSNIILNNGVNGLFDINSAIDGVAYFWNNVVPNIPEQGGTSEGYNGDNYAVYNLSGGTKGASSSTEVPNGIVKVGQGFIVKAKSSANGSLLTFNNEMRVTGTSTFFDKNNSSDKDRFWLKMETPDHNIRTLLIAYVVGGTNGFEYSYDAPMLGMSSDALFSVLGDEKLSIQGRQYPLDTKDVVSLGSNHYVAGDYVISIQKTEGIFANGQNIYLKDNQTNTVTNLSAENYTFAANEGLTEGRFEIIYENEIVLGTGSSKKEELIVYRDGTDFIIKSASKKISEVEVYDTSGRLILQLNPNHTEIRIDGSAMINGVYVLKINRNGEVHTKKITK